MYKTINTIIVLFCLSIMVTGCAITSSCAAYSYTDTKKEIHKQDVNNLHQRIVHVNTHCQVI